MRNAGLDILRAVAIFMVLGQHAKWPDGHLGAIWTHGGWAGVDLFFVLSGFLVSGLLFKNSAPGRFLIRRAWKIYPAFWAMMFVTAIHGDKREAEVEWEWPAESKAQQVAHKLSNFFQRNGNYGR